MKMAEDYDYTQGEDIPESAMSAENFSIGGSGVIEHDANKTEQENSFRDLEPGDYLLKVIGFGDVAPKAKSGFLNGQSVQYQVYQVEVRFADTQDPSGRIRAYFQLPPEDPAHLKYYNKCTTDKEGKKPPGFMAKQFDHFIDRLLPDAAYSVVKGSKVLSPLARQLSNWKGRLIWAQVDEGKQDATKTNPTTGEPYPARAQIKMFSYRAYKEGEGSPYPAKGTKRAATPGGKASRPEPVSVANGEVQTAELGLDYV
jgi:hypothetical protein